MVVTTKPVDIDGGTDFAPSGLSTRESFVEAPPGGSIQVDIGETWDAGEDVYVGGNGDLNGVTFRVVWNPQPIQGQNPGTVVGSKSHVVFEYTA